MKPVYRARGNTSTILTDVSRLIGTPSTSFDGANMIFLCITLFILQKSEAFYSKLLSELLPTNNMMAKTVCFNVGGRRYEVSCSLLEKNPNTMLAQSASEQWQVNPGEEVFLERDGDRFSLVLEYLQNDGHVHLPMMTVSKAAFLADLVYLGIKVDESKIVCKYDCAASLLANMDDEIKSWDAHSNIVILAKECISIYTKSGCKLQIEIHDPKTSLPLPNDNYNDDDDDDTTPMCSLDTWMALLSLFCKDGNGIFPHAQVECNEYLVKIGLEIIKAVRLPDKGIIQVTMTLTDM
jgi:hypothetical protein